MAVNSIGKRDEARGTIIEKLAEPSVKASLERCNYTMIFLKLTVSRHTGGGDGGEAILMREFSQTLSRSATIKCSACANFIIGK